MGQQFLCPIYFAREKTKLFWLSVHLILDKLCDLLSAAFLLMISNFHMYMKKLMTCCMIIVLLYHLYENGAWIARFAHLQNMSACIYVKFTEILSNRKPGRRTETIWCGACFRGMCNFIKLLIRLQCCILPPVLFLIVLLLASCICFLRVEHFKL